MLAAAFVGVCLAMKRKKKAAGVAAFGSQGSGEPVMVQYESFNGQHADAKHASTVTSEPYSPTLASNSPLPPKSPDVFYANAAPMHNVQPPMTGGYQMNSPPVHYPAPYGGPHATSYPPPQPAPVSYEMPSDALSSPPTELH